MTPLDPDRRWIRVAAVAIDLFVLGGGLLLAASGLVFVGLLFDPAWAPALERVLEAARILFVLLFLFRDTTGTSPGKRLAGLVVVGPAGQPPGLIGSLTRNLGLLVPVWNAYELVQALRRPDGRRPGDRLAGTHLSETG